MLWQPVVQLVVFPNASLAASLRCQRLDEPRDRLGPTIFLHGALIRRQILHSRRSTALATGGYGLEVRYEGVSPISALQVLGSMHF